MRGALHIQTVNSRHSEIKGFLPGFRGIATKNLDSYLSVVPSHRTRRPAMPESVSCGGNGQSMHDVSLNCAINEPAGGHPGGAHLAFGCTTAYARTVALGDRPAAPETIVTPSWQPEAPLRSAPPVTQLAGETVNALTSKLDQSTAAGQLAISEHYTNILPTPTRNGNISSNRTQRDKPFDYYASVYFGFKIEPLAKL